MKIKFSTRTLINKNDKLFLGIFIGCIFMMAYYLIINTFVYHNYKDFLSQSKGIVTLGLSVFAAMKVLKWYETKRNDKGFEVAQSIIMSTYNALAIASKMRRMIDDVIGYRIVNDEEVNDSVREKLDQFIEENHREFIEHHTKAFAASMSLKKWNITRKPDMTEPLNRIKNSIDEYILFLKWVSQNKNIGKEEFMERRSELEKLEFYLKNEIEEYNELSIDDIYEFNN